MDKLLAKIEIYLLYGVVFLFPIIVLGISPNPFVVPRLVILSFGIALVLLVRAVRIISAGKLDLSLGRYDLSVGVIALSYLLATVLRTPNKMEALLLPGTTTIVLAGAFLYYLVNQLKTENKHFLTLTLLVSGAVYSLLTVLAFVGVFEAIPQLPSYIKVKSFSPEGGYLPAAVFLAALLPLGIGTFLAEKNSQKKLIIGAATGILLLGLGVSVFNILPGQPFSPRFLSLNASWQIAVDSLKESPLLGVGPGNYLTAFNRFRPLFYNFGDLWAIKFTTASNFYLSVLTETGLLGIIGIALLLVTFYKDARREFKESKLVQWGFAGVAPLVSLILLLVLLAVFPGTLVLIVFLFILLSLNTKTKQTTLNLTSKAEGDNVQAEVASRFPAFLIAAPIIVLVLYFFLRGARIVQAEYIFKKSVDALVANNAQGTYDLMRQAIAVNPKVDRYRATFSRVNLLLANAVVQRAVANAQAQEGEKTQVSEEDRNSIAQLVQQAISEGKATVALNPLRAGNWEILARTYQAVAPLAQGADQFAVQTFRQAIALDPLNPNLRIALGGIYFAGKDYDNAINVFNLVATTVKPDSANAHYNLAYALKEKGEIDAAIREMTTVLDLIKDKNSEDYKVATGALEELQSKQQELSRDGTDNLTPPAAGEKQVLQPPLDLPEGSEPPEAPVSPTPTPEDSDDNTNVSVTPLVSPTPSP